MTCFIMFCILATFREEISNLYAFKKLVLLYWFCIKYEEYIYSICTVIQCTYTV